MIKFQNYIRNFWNLIFLEIIAIEENSNHRR